MAFDFKVSDRVKFGSAPNGYAKGNVYTVTKVNKTAKTVVVSIPSTVDPAHDFEYNLTFADFKRLGAAKVEPEVTEPETTDVAKTFRELEAEALAGLAEVTETAAMLVMVGVTLGGGALNDVIAQDDLDALIAVGDGYVAAAQLFGGLADLAEALV